MDKPIHNSGNVSSGVRRPPPRATLGPMNLSASASHALRAVAWLAAHAGDEAVLGRDLARRLEVPPDYLAKVLATLARAGVLRATRGARGGYRLARAPGRIRLAEVVIPFEGRRATAECLLRPGRPCRDTGACSAHVAWGRVSEAFRGFLERTSVGDLGGGPLPQAGATRRPPDPPAPRRAPRRRAAGPGRR